MFHLINQPHTVTLSGHVIPTQVDVVAAVVGSSNAHLTSSPPYPFSIMPFDITIGTETANELQVCVYL